CNSGASEQYYWHGLSPHFGDAANWCVNADGSGGAPPRPALADSFSDSALAPVWQFVDADKQPGGTVEQSDGELVLSSSGYELWESDADFAGVWRADIAGDFDVSVRVTALDSTHEWAKAGILIANDIHDLSTGGFGLVGVCPGPYGAFVNYDRDGNGTLEHCAVSGQPVSFDDLWVRITRSGATVTSYYRESSADPWTAIDSARTLDSTAANSHVCLFVFSHDTTQTCTAAFDDFDYQAFGAATADRFDSPTIGSDWAFVDRDGQPGGSATVNDNKLVLSGAGYELWDSTHQYVGVTRADIYGDFDVVVRVDSLTPVHEWTKAGIMVANDIDDHAQGGYCLVGATPGHGAIWDWDNDGDGRSDWHRNSGAQVSFDDLWLRLRRIDTTFAAFYKEHRDSAWIPIWQDHGIASAAPKMELCLFVFSHDTAQAATAVLDDFYAVSSGRPLPESAICRFDGTGTGSDAACTMDRDFQGQSVLFGDYAGTFSFDGHTLSLLGDAAFGSGTVVSHDGGTLAFVSDTGVQTLTPPGDTLPAILHQDSSTLRLATAPLLCDGLTQSGGQFDLQGLGVTTVGGADLTVTNGVASTLTGLSGATLTVAGNASFSGTEEDLLNLSPSYEWTIAAAGALTGDYARIGNSNATQSTGQATGRCIDEGNNTNWEFTTDWSLWAHTEELILNTGASGAPIASGLADFPMLVRLDSDNFDFSQAAADGRDIRFTKPDSTPLPFEIEHWDSASATAAVWVLLDTVYAGSVSQSVRMHWGNPYASSISNAGAVFGTSAGFAAVWHLHESPGDGAYGHLDATTNANAAKPVNFQDGGSGTTDTAGLIGGADYLDATNDWLLVEDNDALDPANDLTVSAWVRISDSTALTDGGVILMGRNDESGGAPWCSYLLQVDSDMKPSFWWGGADSVTYGAGASKALSQDDWHHVCAVRKSGDSLRIYVDGVEATAWAQSPQGAMLNSSWELRIGAENAGNGSRKLNGFIDEPRVESLARSAEWIRLCYESQKPRQALWAMGQPGYADDDDDGVPNVVEDELGEDVSTADLAIPSAWINDPAREQLVVYDFSHLPGYSGSQAISMTIDSGTLVSVYNPLFLKVDTLDTDMPSLEAPDTARIAGLHDIRFSLAPTRSLVCGFPLYDGISISDTAELLVEHFLASDSSWDTLSKTELTEGVVYARLEHNGPVLLWDSVITVRFVHPAADTVVCGYNCNVGVQVADDTLWYTWTSLRAFGIWDTLSECEWCRSGDSILAICDSVRVMRGEGIRQCPGDYRALIWPLDTLHIDTPYMTVRYRDFGVEKSSARALTEGLNRLAVQGKHPILYRMYYDTAFVMYTPPDTVIVRVDSAAGFGGNGLDSWGNAFGNLQSAMAAYRDIDTAVDFWVARGTYYVSDSTDRTESFVLKPQWRLYGGFDGDEDLVCQRDWRVNRTALSGDIGMRGDHSDDCFHVVRGASFGTIDGFTIADSRPTDISSNGSDNQGGGIYNDSVNHMIIANCDFRNHEALYGASMYNRHTFMTVTGCLFTNRVADDEYALTTGMWNESSTLTMRDCVFEIDDYLEQYGGDVLHCVSDAYPCPNPSSVVMENCAFVSDGRCGAVEVSGGSDARIVNCTFYGHGGEPGAAATTLSVDGRVDLRNSILVGDTSDFTMIVVYPAMNPEWAGTLSVANSYIDGGLYGPRVDVDSAMGAVLIDLGGNLGAQDASPGFVNPQHPAGPDTVYGSRDDGLRLLASSICVDTCPTDSAPAVDMVGVARPQGSKADMGAYEHFGVSVQFTYPSRDTLVNVASLEMQYYSMGRIHDTTVTFASDTDTIVVNDLGPDAMVYSDTLIIAVDTLPPVVEIEAPSNGSETNADTVRVSWTVDGVSQTSDTLAPLELGQNCIVRSALDSAHNYGVDSVWVTKGIAPRVIIVTPSADTLSEFDTLRVYYSIDEGDTVDTLFTLATGLNRVVIDTVGAHDLRGADTVHVLSCPGSSTIYAEANASDTVFSYQYLVLDAHGSAGPEGVPLRYTWSLLNTEPLHQLFIPNPSWPLIRVLARDPMALYFQLGVSDTLGILDTTAYDTVTVEVVEPQDIYDYLSLAGLGKASADKGMYLSVNKPSPEFSHYTNDTFAVLSGSISGPADSGSILWDVYNSSGLDTGSCIVWGNSFGGLEIPLTRGDNWITLVYQVNDWERAAADRILISQHPSMQFKELEMVPGVLWCDSTMSVAASVAIHGGSPDNVFFVRYVGRQESAFAMLDDGYGADSLAGDSVFSTATTLHSETGSIYHHRVMAVEAFDTAWSGLCTHYPRPPYTPQAMRSTLSTNDMAASLYFSIKQAAGRRAALDSTTVWLLEQPEVTMAGAAPGGMALCWEFENGIHSMISDGPPGTKGSTDPEKVQVTGVAPYFWEFTSNQQYPGQYDDLDTLPEAKYSGAYQQLRAIPTRFDTDDEYINYTRYHTRVPIDAWKEWDRYRAVVVSTHGNTFGYDSSEQCRMKPSADTLKHSFFPRATRFARAFTALETYIEATIHIDTIIDSVYGDTVLDSARSPYWEDLTTMSEPRLILSHDPNDSSWDYAITPAFFGEYNDDLDTTLVFLGACRSMYYDVVFGSPETASMWRMLRDQCSAPVCIGYNNYTPTLFAHDMGRILFGKMANGSKLSAALDSAVAYADSHPSYAVIGGCPAEDDAVKAVTVDTSHFPDTIIYYRPSMLIAMGDSDFVLVPPTYQWFDLGAAAQQTGENDLYVYDYTGFYSSDVEGDSVVVTDAHGRKVVLHQPMDDMLYFQDSARCTFIVEQTDTVHAEAIYVSANTIEMPDGMAGWPVAYLDAFFSAPTKSCSLRTELRYHDHLRNDEWGTACDGNDTMHTWAPLDSNSVVLDSVLNGDRYSYMDMLEIPLPDSVWSYRLDSIRVTKLVCLEEGTPHADGSRCEMLGHLYLRALSVRRRP
ncbi:MAG: DUF2341 domain-containing protein, partial [Chitinivibrionales bacterium]|nr:DUF2341 domain-containing protein [Chitinivibrionales bacterium]